MAIVPENCFVVDHDRSPGSDIYFVILKPGDEYDDGSGREEDDARDIFDPVCIELLRPGEGTIAPQEDRDDAGWVLATNHHMLFNWEGTLIDLDRPRHQDEGLDVCLLSLRRLHALMQSKRPR